MPAHHPRADAGSSTTDAWTALWRHRCSADVRLSSRVVVVVIAAVGLAAVLRLVDAWFRTTNVSNPTLFVLLSLAFWYGVSRIVLGWINYAAVSSLPHRPAPAGKRVAIFTTSAPGEPLGMFEKTLAACARITYPHTTYLLDDTRDPRFVDLARRHGAVRLELLDVPGAKAGKINRALDMTHEDFVLVLDPDHIPFPEFLDRVIGRFDDEGVGFVQVAQAYYNQQRSFTAAGAAEQTYVFYGPTQMGLHGHRACVAIGANCTFRRTALASIGGHGTGLAEDLVTAIRLHAAGWRSVYVPEILSRGLVPEDLASFGKQQLKWARGVYEVAFAELPRLFWTLSWRQRLSYVTIGTYYLSGVTTAIFLVFPYLYLWTGVQPMNMPFGAFLRAAAPVAMAAFTMYVFIQRWLCHPAQERGLHWRGLVLKLACWPIYLRGSLLALVRADIPYVPTPKRATHTNVARLAWPHLLLLACYFVTCGEVVYERLLTGDVPLDRSPEAVWGMIGFATVPAAAAVAVLYAAYQSHALPDTDPWERVDISQIGGPA